MKIDNVAKAKSRYLRLQIAVATISGLLAFGLFWWDLNSAVDGAVIGVTAAVEIAIAGRILYSVFQFYQPKKTLSLNAIIILLLLSLIIAHLTQYIDLHLISSDISGVRYLGIELHITILFFILSILYYEWWFLKNELINQQSTQRLLLLQEDLKNAEIRVIQQNVQPHFLFNSLNSINSLILIDGIQAQEMVVRLSEFLRHSVIKNQKMFVSLKEEIDQVRRYFSIEQIRFSSRLQCEIAHDEENNDIQIPSMILQPLVENAIKHGLYGQIDQAKIRLDFIRQEPYLLVRMENPFDEEMKVPNKKGTGFGLESIRKKLFLLFAENDLLTTHSEGSKFITTVKIPLNYESIDH